MVVSRTPAPAIAGFALIGVGIAVVVPLCFAAAGRRGPNPSQAIAGVATVTYTSGLIAPAAIGGIAGASSLTVSFALVTVLTLGLVLGAGVVRPHPGRGGRLRRRVAGRPDGDGRRQGGRLTPAGARRGIRTGPAEVAARTGDEPAARESAGRRPPAQDPPGRGPADSGTAVDAARRPSSGPRPTAAGCAPPEDRRPRRPGTRVRAGTARTHPEPSARHGVQLLRGRPQRPQVAAGRRLQHPARRPSPPASPASAAARTTSLAAKRWNSSSG